MSSFEGIEEPNTIYHSNTDTFTTNDTYVNIFESDDASNAFRFILRYDGTSWDGEINDTTHKDRGRSEVKGLGPHQAIGETYDYISTMKVSSNWQNTGRFAHAFQLFAVNNNSSVSYVVQMELSGSAGHGQVQFYPQGTGSEVVARSFTFTNDTYTTYKIQVKGSSSGYVKLGINGGSLSGANGNLVVANSNGYRPKWGNYRGFNAGWNLGDTYVQHKHIQANKL